MPEPIAPRHDVRDTRGAALSTPLLQRNRLLGSLSTSARLRLLPSVDLLQMRVGQQLERGGVHSGRAYFPVTALLALYQETVAGGSAQVAMVGHEGMVGLSLLTGDESSPLRSVVQSPGVVLAVEGHKLQQEFYRGGQTMRVLLRYTQSLMDQMAQMALCNRHHAIEQQLSRWLLMASDRLGSRDVEVTQEMVAHLLGVRREGVTEAAGRLRAAGAIACRRGRFTVLDRSLLESRSCECYAALRAEYDRGEHAAPPVEDEDGSLPGFGSPAPHPAQTSAMPDMTLRER